MSKKKKPKRPKPRGPRTPTRFALGSPVRVKPGIKDPDFPDIPLGGWSGTVLDVEQGSHPPEYLITWDERTLAAMPPVYRQRCQRDGLILNCVWLDEDDLEADTGKPAAIEQPTQIVTRPLRLNDREDRIRAILGLTSEDPLPEVDAPNLGKYHTYLAHQLTFPFRASRSETGGWSQPRRRPITVTALLDPDPGDAIEGLLCEAVEKDEEIELPLAAVEKVAAGTNGQLVEDYRYWFWNCQGEGAELGEPVLLPYLERLAGQRDETRVSSWEAAKAFLLFGLVGAFYGAVLGAALAALEGAGVAMKVGAVLLGIVIGLVGAYHGQVYGDANRIPHGKWFGGSVGVVVGALLGGMVGVMLVAFLGTLTGAVIGGLLGRWLGSAPAKALRTGLGAFGGALLGVGIQSGLQTGEAAFFGLWVGGLTGAVAGPLLVFTFNVVLIILEMNRRPE